MAEPSKKGAPKLKRAGRASNKAKYAAQFQRTYRNKLRRIRRSNGPNAALKWMQTHMPGGGRPIEAPLALPKRKTGRGD